MISFVVFSLRRAWQGFWRNALMSLAATATMVLMLVLLSGFRIILDTKETAKNVKTVTDIMRTAGSVILVVIGVIVLFIIVNTIRLAVVARAEEIEIMRLVGASDAFIRWPFVFEGAMVGLLGAVITLVGLYLLAEPISGFMVDFFRVLPLSFGSLARDLVVIVTSAGLGLGVLGSWLSARTYPVR